MDTDRDYPQDAKKLNHAELLGLMKEWFDGLDTSFGRDYIYMCAAEGLKEYRTKEDAIRIAEEVFGADVEEEILTAFKEKLSLNATLEHFRSELVEGGVTKEDVVEMIQELNQ